MADEILTCAFCGYTKTEEVMNGSLRALECLNCHAQGPYVDGLECPAAAWNSRSPDTEFLVEDPGYE